MRLIFACSFGEGSYGHIIRQALQDIMVDIIPFDYRALEFKEGGAEMNREFRYLLKNEIYDAVLVFKGEYIDPKIFEGITARKILWWPDSLWRYRSFKELAPHFDEVYTIAKCDDYGFLPMGSYPKVFHEYRLTSEERVKYDCDVGIAGTAHPARVEILYEIFKRIPQKYSIKVWGNDWPTNLPWLAGGAQYFENLSKAYSGMKIVISSRVDDEFGPEFRAFEATACKRLFMTSPCRGLDLCFEPGIEYVPYTSVDDAVEKVVYYLEHDEERKAIARMGMLRCLNTHLLKDELEKLLLEGQSS